MKLLNSIAIGIVVIFFFVIVFYMEEVSSAYWDSIFNYDYNNYSYSSYNNASSLTEEAGFITLLFLLFFIFVYIANLVKIKTITTRVMTIIGLSFTLLTLFVNFGTIANPGALSYNETGFIFLLYNVVCLAFVIVLLVQSVNHLKKGTHKDSDILDLEIE